jgi:MFS family permease
MEKILKEGVIYLCTFLVVSSYTMIIPFYSDIAQTKEVSFWVIELVLIIQPLAGLFTTIILGRYMFIVGRKCIVVISFLLLALSMFILSPIETCNTEGFIVLSFSSRILAGVASGCIMISSDSIFATEFSDEIEIMMGKVEGVTGIGLMAGPLIGILLTLNSLSISLSIAGAIIIGIMPIAWYMIGDFQGYQIHKTNRSLIKLLFKPVILI